MHNVTVVPVSEENRLMLLRPGRWRGVHCQVRGTTARTAGDTGAFTAAAGLQAVEALAFKVMLVAMVLCASKRFKTEKSLGIDVDNVRMRLLSTAHPSSRDVMGLRHSSVCE